MTTTKTDLIEAKAWAVAVTQEHEGKPLWIYLADNPKCVAVARALLNAYLAHLDPHPLREHGLT